MTVSMWVRSDEVPTDGAVLFEKGARACGEPTIGLYVDGSGLEVRLTAYGPRVVSAPLQVDLGLWDGLWHHVSFTQGVSNDVRVYVDGTGWGTGRGAFAIDHTYETVDEFSFGSAVLGSDCDAPEFIGDLDDVRVFDRDLDQNQIGALEPPIATTTTVQKRTDAAAKVFRCWQVNVVPPPGGGGELRVSELLADGREVDIGLASNEWCEQYHGATLVPGAYFVPLQFDTKGTHKIRGRFIPGDPWQASTSPWVDQVVAGVPTTTFIDVDPVGAEEPFEVRASVLGSGDSMSGSVALYDVTAAPTHIDTKTLPVTGAASSSVTFQLSGRPAGTYQLQVRYLGDSDVFEPSSASMDVLVTGSSGPTDTTPPTAIAPTWRLVNGSAISAGRTTVRLAWSGSDTTSGIDRYELAQSTDGGGWTSVSTSLTATSLDRALAHGHAYRFRVRAVDTAGNVGAWMTGPTFRLTHYGESSSKVTYSGSWSTSTSSVYWGGKARASSQAGAKATLTFTGRSVEVVSRKGPARGKAQIYVNGVLKATVDLYASSYQNQRVVWAGSWSSSASRTITVRVLGTAGRPRVDLDAFVVGS